MLFLFVLFTLVISLKLEKKNLEGHCCYLQFWLLYLGCQYFEGMFIFAETTVNIKSQGGKKSQKWLPTGLSLVLGRKNSVFLLELCYYCSPEWNLEYASRIPHFQKELPTA